MRWLTLLVIFTLTLLISMFAAIFGYTPTISSLLNLNTNNMTGMLYSLGYSMLALLPLTILAGLAHDLEG